MKIRHKSDIDKNKIIQTDNIRSSLELRLKPKDILNVPIKK